MKHSEFSIGNEFVTGSGTWRCTDVGTRTIVAIRVDQVTVTTLIAGETTQHVLDREEAERDGWFKGPTYPVAETVFDEDDIEGCEPLPAT